MKPPQVASIQHRGYWIWDSGSRSAIIVARTGVPLLDRKASTYAGDDVTVPVALGKDVGWAELGVSGGGSTPSGLIGCPPCYQRMQQTYLYLVWHVTDGCK